MFSLAFPWFNQGKFQNEVNILEDRDFGGLIPWTDTELSGTSSTPSLNNDEK
jgi:hypothetical protein